MLVDVKTLLRELSVHRPIFHSEADFQHALAWEIHRQLPDSSVRLEFPASHSARQLYLDVWIAHDDDFLAIEMKYKTRAVSVRVGDELFSLESHAAQPLGRYDFIKDIQRLEQITSGHSRVEGCAILLTNDSAYWTRPRGSEPVDAKFRIDEGRSIHGTLAWGAGASSGTRRGREQPLEVKGTYVMHWEAYSQPSPANYGRFRFLAIQVDR